MMRADMASSGRPRRMIGPALMLAGAVTVLAACGDYGPPTGSNIQSDIDSSLWINQLPQDQPHEMPSTTPPPVAAPVE